MNPNPWDQMEKETAKAYQYFLVYLELGLSRTHKKVHQKLGGNLQQIIKWAGLWDWKERVLAFDKAQIAPMLEAKIGNAQEVQREVVEDLVADYQMMLQDWREGYEERKKLEDKDGNLVPLTADERIKFTSARKSIDDMIRRSVGLPNAIKDSNETNKPGNKGNTIPGKIIKWRSPALPNEIAE